MKINAHIPEYLIERLNKVTAVIKHTKGIEMLISVLTEYIYSFQNAVQAYVEKAYVDFVHLYNDGIEFDYIAIDDKNNSFL